MPVGCKAFQLTRIQDVDEVGVVSDVGWRQVGLSANNKHLAMRRTEAVARLGHWGWAHVLEHVPSLIWAGLVLLALALGHSTHWKS